ncbi:MAG: hypothetical protein ABFD54_04805 [Armatimonadota bacterium]|nr:hypothetical protein [bacterium]
MRINRAWSLFFIITIACISTQVCGADAKPGVYDIDASGTEVRYVLEALARQSGANIVVSPEVAGQISAHLKQQPLEGILDSLAAVHGFAWKKDGANYLVAPKATFNTNTPAAPVATPEQVVFIWECHNVQASQLAEIIIKLFPSVTATEGPGTLLPNFNEHPNQSSDTSGSAPAISVGSITSSQSSSASSSQSSQSSTGDSINTRRGSKLILAGPAADIEKAKDIIKQLDVRKKQVTIELMITEVKSTFDKELGVDWSWDTVSVKQGYTPESGNTTGSTTETYTAGSEDAVKTGSTTNVLNPMNVKMGQTRWAVQPWNFQATLSAMVKDGTAKLLAKPNVCVLDGEPARIFLGNTVRYLQLDSRDQDGRPIYRADSVDAGILLPIAPHIVSDNEVMLTLHPQVSLITGYTKVEGSEYPLTSTREVSTTVVVKSGETLAIGGLLHDEDLVSASKVPLMGDLPIIGGLFRSNSRNTERTELVIFLTPKILGE